MIHQLPTIISKTAEPRFSGYLWSCSPAQFDKPVDVYQQIKSVGARHDMECKLSQDLISNLKNGVDFIT